MGERGCGSRRPGLYLETLSGPGGKPLDYFLLCPPQPIPEGIVVPDLGAVVAEYGGHYHVFKRIGLSGYPNVADWIEETRHKGSSMRISPQLPLHLLTPGKSGQFFIHDRAIIENWYDYGDPSEPAATCESAERSWVIWEGWGAEYGRRMSSGECPRGEHFFPPRDSHCLTMAYEDVEGGEADPDRHPRAVLRSVGDLTYRAYRRPDLVTPEYTQAIFAWLPVGRVAVFESADEEENKKLWESAKKSGFAAEQIWE